MSGGYEGSGQRPGPATLAVNLIGAGRIGGAVAVWLRASPRYRLQEVIGRGTADWTAAALSIDTAGPGALRRLGPRLLAEGDLWSVGAAALADEGFRAEMAEIARRSGHRLRLFTGWIAGPNLAPFATAARLHVTQMAPNLGPQPGILFNGPLAEAVLAFPDHLNTACAAALAGPGIGRTSIELISSELGGAHLIRAEFAMPGSRIVSEVNFTQAPGELHPVSSAIIAALERQGLWLTYG